MEKVRHIHSHIIIYSDLSFSDLTPRLAEVLGVQFGFDEEGYYEEFNAQVCFMLGLEVAFYEDIYAKIDAERQAKNQKMFELFVHSLWPEMSLPDGITADITDFLVGYIRRKCAALHLDIEVLPFTPRK